MVGRNFFKWNLNDFKWNLCPQTDPTFENMTDDDTSTIASDLDIGDRGLSYMLNVILIIIKLINSNQGYRPVRVGKCQRTKPLSIQSKLFLPLYLTWWMPLLFIVTSLWFLSGLCFGRNYEDTIKNVYLYQCCFWYCIWHDKCLYRLLVMTSLWFVLWS